MKTMTDLIERYQDREALWKTCDTEDLLKRKDEQTTSANVGAYEAPFGPVLRAVFPAPGVLDDYLDDIDRAFKRKKKRKRGT